MLDKTTEWVTYVREGSLSRRWWLQRESALLELVTVPQLARFRQLRYLAQDVVVDHVLIGLTGRAASPFVTVTV